VDDDIRAEAEEDEEEEEEGGGSTKDDLKIGSDEPGGRGVEASGFVPPLKVLKGGGGGGGGGSVGVGALGCWEVDDACET